MGIELPEDLLGRRPEFGSDHFGDRLVGYRQRGILQPAQLAHIFGGEQIGAGAKDLPEFDEGGAQLFNGEAEVLGAAVRLRPPSMSEPAPLKRHDTLQAQLDDEKSEAVADHRGDDLAEATSPR